MVVWSYQWFEGGCLFGYIGVYFFVLLVLFWLVFVNVIVWMVGFDLLVCVDVIIFYYDVQCSGWFVYEMVLMLVVVFGGFGQFWQLLQLVVFDGQDVWFYVLLLYVEDLQFIVGELCGQSFVVVIVVISNGDVYVINVCKQGDIVLGCIFWCMYLVDFCCLQFVLLDGVLIGIFFMLVIDVVCGCFYVIVCEIMQCWQVYVLDLGSGVVQVGWLVWLDEKWFNEVNCNVGFVLVLLMCRFDFCVQCGVLNLSLDGMCLYVVFGEIEIGWLVVVDTKELCVDSVFVVVVMLYCGSGGIWGVGGFVVDVEGLVYMVIGSGFDGYKDQLNDWM